MNDADEAALLIEFDKADDRLYDAEAEAEDRRARQKGILDQWRKDHDFMFAKRRDEEDWDDLVRSVVNA